MTYATAGWVKAHRVSLFGLFPDTSPSLPVIFRSLLTSTKCYQMIPFPSIFSPSFHPPPGVTKM